MRVFLTGATGFVGGHMVDLLIEEGHTVRALVRPGHDEALAGREGVEVVTGSLADEATLREALNDVDAIVHLAGKYKQSTPAELIDVNAAGTRRLAGAALEACPDLSRLVFVSSIAAAGPGPEDLSPCTEDAPPEPLSVYGRSKRMAEEQLLEVADRLPVTIIRPPIIYGPGDRSRLKLFRRAKRRVVPHAWRGGALLSVVYVEDLCRAILLALTRDHDSGRVFYVEDGRAVTWKQLTSLVGESLGVRPQHVGMPGWMVTLATHATATYGRVRHRSSALTPDRVGELRARNWACSSKAIQEALGWEPTTTLADGIQATADWYRDAGWL